MLDAKCLQEIGKSFPSLKIQFLTFDSTEFKLDGDVEGVSVTLVKNFDKRYPLTIYAGACCFKSKGEGDFSLELEEIMSQFRSSKFNLYQYLTQKYTDYDIS